MYLKKWPRKFQDIRNFSKHFNNYEVCLGRYNNYERRLSMNLFVRHSLTVKDVTVFSDLIDCGGGGDYYREKT